MHAAVREIKNLDKTGKMSGMTERATPSDDYGIHTRVTGTQFTSERLQPGELAQQVCAIWDGDRLVGIVEYVGIKLRGGKGTTYGWRPQHSGWTASRLRTKREAVLALSARKAA